MKSEGLRDYYRLYRLYGYSRAHAAYKAIWLRFA